METMVLEVSSVIGLTGAVSGTANICLGLLIAIRYNPQRRWPYTRINCFAAYNYTAFAVLATIVAHPLVLLFATKPRRSLWQMGFPVWSPAQPMVSIIGTFGMYSIVVVVITSYLRKRIGRQRWKSFHFLVYPVCSMYLCSRHSGSSQTFQRPNRSLGHRKAPH